MLLGMTPARQIKSLHPVTLHRAIPGFLLSLGVSISAGLMIFGVNELRTMESRIAALDFNYTVRPRFWQTGIVCNVYTLQNKVTN
jgi:ABC-type antimicrobial peptide transport system permease subunit